MYKLIMSIVPHNSGEFITNAAKEAGAGGGTIVMARGTASNSIIQLLGLGDTSKDITMNIIDESIENKVYSHIQELCQDKKSHFGVMFTINLNSFSKAGNDLCDKQIDVEKKVTEENDMANYEMINIIVNKGYAEDAMAAARKAGAGGGTIIGARGTAREGDATFFGVDIVPEKEMLLILVPKDKKSDIIKAINELPCFAKAGSGIVFCNDANNFTLLGKK